VELTSV